MMSVRTRRNSWDTNSGDEGNYHHALRPCMQKMKNLERPRTMFPADDASTRCGLSFAPSIRSSPAPSIISSPAISPEIRAKIIRPTAPWERKAVAQQKKQESFNNTMANNALAALASPQRTNLYSPKGRSAADKHLEETAFDSDSDDEEMLPPSVAVVKKQEQKIQQLSEMPKKQEVKPVERAESKMVVVQKKLGITSFCEEGEESLTRPTFKRSTSLDNVESPGTIVWKSTPVSIKNSMVLKALLSPVKTHLSSSKTKTEAEKKYAAKYGLLEEEEFSDDDDDDFTLAPSMATVKEAKQEVKPIVPLQLKKASPMVAVQKCGVTSFREEGEESEIKRRSSCPSASDALESSVVWKSDPTSFTSSSIKSTCSKSTIDTEEFEKKIRGSSSTSVCLSYDERKVVVAGNYTQEQIYLTENIEENQRTTIMLRNIPNKYTKSTLLALIQDELPQLKIDFFYLPIDFRSKSNMGYCFLNFEQPEHARTFMREFTDFNRWQFNSNKKAEVIWSEPYQGLAGHIDRYRNSPVMHESVEEEYKPSIFLDGESVSFPECTASVEPPKLRRCKKKKNKSNAAPMGFRVPN